MNKTIMAVGAHADDVEIQFGGTLFKYLDKGYSVVYVQSTNNMSGSKRQRQPDGSWKGQGFGAVETMRYRKAECEAAAALFHTTPVHLDHPQRHYRRDDGTKGEVRYGCDLPPGVPPDVPSILTAHEDVDSVRRVTDLMLTHDPEIVFSHGFVDKNPEHTTTALLVTAAYWKAVEAGYRGSLVHSVKVRFQTGFGRFHGRWETWTDVTGFEDRKIESIQKHVSQFPPDFVDGDRYYRAFLAEYGATCGVGAAELFAFVNPVEPGADDGLLLAELLRNRNHGQCRL